MDLGMQLKPGNLCQKISDLRLSITRMHIMHLSWSVQAEQRSTSQVLSTRELTMQNNFALKHRAGQLN